MVRGGATVHHIHKRKRFHKNLEPYPHPDRWMRLLDKLILFLAIAGPMGNIPQIIQIFTQRTAAGLSLVTWVFFVVITIPWIIYGIIHKEKPIVIANVLWFVLQVVVVIGILMYG